MLKKGAKLELTEKRLEANRKNATKGGRKKTGNIPVRANKELIEELRQDPTERPTQIVNRVLLKACQIQRDRGFF